MDINTYLIAGGSGFLGNALIAKLQKNNKKIYVLTRGATILKNNVQYINWDVTKATMDFLIPEQDIAIINLAGAGVADKRWSKERKLEISTSRINSTNTLYELIKNKSIKASSIFCASAIGYYAQQSKLYNELDESGDDFLAETCIAWEEASQKIRNLNIPVSIGRIGIVMGAGGGAVKEFVKFMKIKIAGIPGNGKQIYSWIHIDDIVDAILFLLQHRKNEVYNLVAPQPVSVQQLVHELALNFVGKHLCINTPNFFIKLLLGEMSVEVLKNLTVSSNKIITHGYTFKYANYKDAMQAIGKTLKDE